MNKVGCESCVGACCRAGIWMSLNTRQVEFMECGGTKLGEILFASTSFDWKANAQGVFEEDPDAYKDDPPKRRKLEIALSLKRGYGAYILQDDCGYLDTGGAVPQCTAHEDPERPKICRDFKPGSLGCLNIRSRAGVGEVSLQLMPKPAAQ